MYVSSMVRLLKAVNIILLLEIVHLLAFFLF